MAKKTTIGALPQADEGPDPDDVWGYVEEDDTSYLLEPIETAEQICVTPRRYVELKAHGNAEPIVLTSVEALRLARVLEAAATKLERGEGFTR